jgi:hypothetical protein
MTTNYSDGPEIPYYNTDMLIVTTTTAPIQFTAAHSISTYNIIFSRMAPKQLLSDVFLKMCNQQYRHDICEKGETLRSLYDVWPQLCEIHANLTTLFSFAERNTVNGGHPEKKVAFVSSVIMHQP